MKQVVVLNRAQDEILDLLLRLNEQRDGLGEECDEALRNAYLRLAEFPESAPVSIAPPLRRLVLRHFFLGIFYAIHGERVFIHAVLDLRQDPGLIARRLRS